jgi:Flp pilus assembly protein TadD
LANVLVHAGKPEEAIAQYRAAIVLDPQYGYPHNGLGNVLAEEKRFADAAAEYRKAIQLNPKYAAPHDGLGYVLAMMGHPRDAIVQSAGVDRSRPPRCVRLQRTGECFVRNQ